MKKSPPNGGGFTLARSPAIAEGAAHSAKVPCSNTPGIQRLLLLAALVHIARRLSNPVFCLFFVPGLLLLRNVRSIKKTVFPRPTHNAA